MKKGEVEFQQPDRRPATIYQVTVLAVHSPATNETIVSVRCGIFSQEVFNIGFPGAREMVTMPSWRECTLILAFNPVTLSVARALMKIPGQKGFFPISPFDVPGNVVDMGQTVALEALEKERAEKAAAQTERAARGPQGKPPPRRRMPGK